MNVVAHIRYFWYNTHCQIRLQYNVATGYIMAESFFKMKSKSEVESDPGYGACCIATRLVVRNRSGVIACFAVEKLVRGGF